MACPRTSDRSRPQPAASAPRSLRTLLPNASRWVSIATHYCSTLLPGLRPGGAQLPVPDNPLIQHQGKKTMKTAIAKVLTVAAAAVALAGCVSESKFNEHVASSDAAIKAAQQEAAAASNSAKAAADAAKAAADAASHGAEHRQPGAAGCQGRAGLLRREQREDRSRVPEVDGQVIAQRLLAVRGKTPRQPRGVFFCGGRNRGRCSTQRSAARIGVDSGTGTPVACSNTRSAPGQSTSTLWPATAAVISASSPPGRCRAGCPCPRAAHGARRTACRAASRPWWSGRSG